MVVAGALSAGAGAAYAATHGLSHTVKPHVARSHGVPTNLHYPCHNHHGARLTAANL